MNLRYGNPVLAGLIALVTLWLATLAYGGGYLIMCGSDNECAVGDRPTPWNYLAGALVWLGAAAILLAVLWCAWRVGTGRWTLRRQPGSPEPSMPA